MFGEGSDWEVAERRIDQWQEGIEQRAAAVRRLSGRLAQLSARASSADGQVEVTVGPTGQVTELRLDEQIRERPASTTADQILATIQAAARELTRLAGAATEETVGLDSETGRAIVASYAGRLAPTRAAGAPVADPEDGVDDSW